MTGWTSPTPAGAILSAAALMLAGLLGLEIASAPADDPPMPRIVQTSATLAPATAALPMSDWAAALLQRPLFDPTRALPPAPASEAPLPRLTAIIAARGHRLAIFQPDSGKSVFAQEGDSLGGYAIQAITPTGVTLDGPKGRSTIGFPPPNH